MKFLRSIVGWVMKFRLYLNSIFIRKKQTSNNPKLTELMNENLTFKELKEREIELREEELVLNAKIGHINNFQPEDRWNEIYNQLVDRLEVVKDLLFGITTKLVDVGYVYIVTYKKTIKKQYPIEQTETYTDEIKLLVEKPFDNQLTPKDYEEILRLTHLKVPYEILNIRLIDKNKQKPHRQQGV